MAIALTAVLVEARNELLFTINDMLIFAKGFILFL